MDWIEIVGYAGSALVLVSFLMTSVFKLRVVNTVGSIIFAIYALIIRSYPTAVMNIALVCINLHFLWKMRTSSKAYELVAVEPGDAFLGYLLTRWADDIKACFPGISLDTAAVNSAYVLTCEGGPAGMALGVREGDALDITLDYSLPAYRDFSLGSFLFSELAKQGVRTVTYKGPDKNHLAYLEKMGFENKDGAYVKALG